MTLEKYLSNNLYYMVNGSYYQSRYTALDGIERNTHFNGNYVFNFTAGKDYVYARHTGRQNVLVINIRTMWAGGYRTTPVDDEQSALQGTTVYFQKEAYTLKNTDYFRTDLRISLKKDRRHITTTLSMDLQNLTNQRNIYDQKYDLVQKKVINIYQVGIIPVLNYKVEF